MKDSSPAGMRWTIRLLSVVLFFLFIWLLGFIIGDINDLQRPNRQSFYDAGVDAELTRAQEEFNASLEGIRVDKARQDGIKQNRSQAMEVARDTWAQAQKVNQFELTAGRLPSDELREELDQAHKRYISAQATFEEANTKAANLSAQEYAIRQNLVTLESQVQPQREEAYALYSAADKDHEHTLAIYKLSFIIPVFLLAAWALAKKRESIYRPILKALILASFLQVGMVMFEHFDAEYFKYIALTVAVLIVLGFLVRLLQSSARPRPDLLLKQRRESYDRNTCPECTYSYPDDHGNEFTCPACGTGLFANCNSCGGSRHNLLPFCIHCGSEEATPAVSV
jgi:ssDNA-binding Zn-finger/Zn-ribbon topoisomerase 1